MVRSFDAEITRGTDRFTNAVKFSVATPLELDTGYFNCDINYNFFCYLEDVFYFSQYLYLLEKMACSAYLVACT